MGEETIEKVLRNLGLTDTEAEVNIFLAKRGVLKCSEVAKQMKKDRAQALRILKSLQSKGLAEATLEVPTRYAPVPFEQVIDLSIKAKKDEAALMENTRNELLNYWKKIGKSVTEPLPDKFMVIEGDKIYAKIAQMIKETKNQLSSIFTGPDLSRGIQLGLFEAISHHPLKSKIQFRFLTELSEQNVTTVKSLLERALKADVNFKGRNPELGLRLFPRMVIRDNVEILFFIRPKTATESGDLSLWTNCTDLVQSFSVVFEDSWTNSKDVRERIMEIETGKPTPTARVIGDVDTARRTYDEVLNSADEEVIMMISSKSLIESCKHFSLLKERIDKGVSVKIMAPITKDNLQAAQELSKFCAVRHAPTSNLDTVIVDGKRLFQSQDSSSRKPVLASHFYTDNLEYVKKTKSVLDELWRNAQAPSVSTAKSISKLVLPAAPVVDGESAWLRRDSPYKKITLSVEKKTRVTTEKEVLNTIINAEKYPADWPKGPVRFYGSSGHTVIHPPDSFGLPDFMIWANHFNKQSSYGAVDLLFIYLWLETPKGYAYVPVARVADAPKDGPGMKFANSLFAGTPAERNANLVKKDELQIRFHGNTFFAGWTKPISLIPSKYTLPPACILLEGYGKLRTVAFESVLPSGAKVRDERNTYDAFVTFYHPASKYSGPGTDGTISRDVVATIYPPSSTEA